MKSSSSGSPGTREIDEAICASSAPSITAQVLTNVNALSDLSSEWEQLWRQTPEVSAFQSLDWILPCVVHAARADVSCFVTVLRAGDQPLAIFPTQLSARGALSFIGAEFSNYCGPLYVPGALPLVVRVWSEVMSAEPRIRSIDFTGLRERSPFFSVLVQHAFPRWGRPVVVEMYTCPEVDLHEGWDKVFRKHKSRQRANWRRKWNSLAELGQLEYLETSDPDELAAAFPKLFELYDSRWRGKRVRRGFDPEQYCLQLEAAKRLGAQGLVRLSLLRLDGEVIAFAYGVRGVTQSTSYVLAHDAAFDVFSPGLLLLIKILEAAAARGDTSYDFSLGNAPYKAMWATGEQRVFSVLLGRGSGFAAIKRRCWRAARSIPLLGRLKQEGLRGLAIRKDGNQRCADQPGLSVGTAAVWHVYRIQNPLQPSQELLCRPLRYSEMRALFSPRLLALALDRHYRGDQALAVKRDGRIIGVIWVAAQHRHSIATGGFMSQSQPEPVYYHPVVAEDEGIEQVVLSVIAEEAVVVCPCHLVGPGFSEIHTFRGEKPGHPAQSRTARR